MGLTIDEKIIVEKCLIIAAWNHTRGKMRVAGENRKADDITEKIRTEIKKLERMFPVSVPPEEVSRNPLQRLFDFVRRK